jgi:peptide/nickel transport system ATP-binding protein/oligopeptide transport system ATP-binding protein
MTPLLQVKELRTYLYTEAGVIRAVDGISFEVETGKVLGIVGESGCGKSMTALSLMRLIPTPPARIVSGEILFNGQDLVKLKESEMRKLRGDRISMVFQEPMTSLNPVFTIGNQIAEILKIHRGMSRGEAWKRAGELLNRVGIPNPERRLKEYPHQLSGGMRQRVMIAMAIACEPALIIADEPTTALDVTVQAQILKLLKDLSASFGTSLILISHDLGIIAETAHTVAIMYAGRIVEYARTEDLFARPRHPYTLGLLKSIPQFEGEKKARLDAIPGTVPKLSELPKGCKFNTRCPFVFDKCDEEPELEAKDPGHLTRCWLPDLKIEDWRS